MSRANVPSKTVDAISNPGCTKAGIVIQASFPIRDCSRGFASVCEYPGSGATPQSSFMPPRSVTAVPMKQPGTELALTLVAS
jgi:hypothetical protein